MPATPDRKAGALIENEELRFETESGASPSQIGAMTYDPGTGTFKLRDTTGVFDPRASSGVSEATHKALNQLIHFIDEGPADGFASGATKTITGTVFPSQILWRRADNTKLVEKNITWSGATATQIEWKMYAGDGTTVLATVTDAIAYNGVFETGRVRSIS